MNTRLEYLIAKTQESIMCHTLKRWFFASFKNGLFDAFSNVFREQGKIWIKVKVQEVFFTIKGKIKELYYLIYIYKLI